MLGFNQQSRTHNSTGMFKFISSLLAQLPHPPVIVLLGGSINSQLPHLPVVALEEWQPNLPHLPAVALYEKQLQLAHYTCCCIGRKQPHLPHLPAVALYESNYGYLIYLLLHWEEATTAPSVNLAGSKGKPGALDIGKQTER